MLSFPVTIYSDLYDLDPPAGLSLSGYTGLTEGEQGHITCAASNVFPEPRMVWYIGGTDVTGTASEDSVDTGSGRFNYSSYITKSFDRNSHGKTVACRAIHTSVSGVEMRIYASATIDIQCEYQI